MGTNYYLHLNECPTCQRPEDSWHIGKSSWGWCFSLNTHPEHGINTLDDWQREWAVWGRVIRDEYDEMVPAAELLETITKRFRKVEDPNQPPSGYRDWNEFYRRNYAEPGPSGLLRHVVDGRHCIGHGDGTYDLMRGEFS